MHVQSQNHPFHFITAGFRHSVLIYFNKNCWLLLIGWNYSNIILFDLMLLWTNHLDVAQKNTFSTKCLFALTQLIIDYLSESYYSREPELEYNFFGFSTHNFFLIFHLFSSWAEWPPSDTQSLSFYVFLLHQNATAMVFFKMWLQMASTVSPSPQQPVLLFIFRYSNVCMYICTYI